MECTYCCKEFQAKVKWQKFCSDKCRNDYNYMNNKCPVCGTKRICPKCEAIH